MPQLRIASSLLLALLALAGAPARAGDAPGAGPPVAAATLLESERFWPYQVALARGWKPPGRPGPLPAGSEGVLIRVLDAKRALVDFGRDGLLEVPVADTDLLERANRIRSGAEPKELPNFVQAIQSRLLDAAAPVLAPYPPREVERHRLFLCAFADPKAEGFEALARALLPLREQAGLLTILFPQGRAPDAWVQERLRALGLRVPFVHAHLSEPYTRTLMPGEPRMPRLLLQTAEGRLLYEGPWNGDLAPLRAALARG